MTPECGIHSVFQMYLSSSFSELWDKTFSNLCISFLSFHISWDTHSHGMYLYEGIIIIQGYKPSSQHVSPEGVIIIQGYKPSRQT